MDGCSCARDGTGASSEATTRASPGVNTEAETGAHTGAEIGAHTGEESGAPCSSDPTQARSRGSCLLVLRCSCQAPASVRDFLSVFCEAAPQHLSSLAAAAGPGKPPKPPKEQLAWNECWWNCRPPSSIQFYLFYPAVPTADQSARGPCPNFNMFYNAYCRGVPKLARDSRPNWCGSFY